jgi:hypothetical protein
MKRDWIIITLPTVIAAFVLAAAGPVREAMSQDLDRKPCVNRASPAGCMPMTRAPRSGPDITTNPDAPGIVPVNDWPATKPKTMPAEWQVAPSYLPESGTGTVTVEPTPQTPE